MTTNPQGPDWRRMARADFDPSAPLTLVDADAIGRPVPAIPDECGTAPLFGEDPKPKRAPGTRRPAATSPQDTDTLF